MALSPLNKFRDLHKQAIGGLLNEKTAEGLETVFSVFDPICLIYKGPRTSFSQPYDKDYLQDLAETVVFPAVKDDTETAVYFQMLLEKRGIVVNASQEKFAGAAKDLRDAWSACLAIDADRLKHMEKKVQELRGKVRSEEWRMTEPALKSFFVKAAQKAAKERPSTQDPIKSETFQCCVLK